MTYDEQDETPLSIFVSEHKSDLVKEFIEDNQELYEEFMKQFGEDTHKFIGEGFAEYHYEIFGRFCQDKFSDYCAGLGKNETFIYDLCSILGV